MLEAKVVEISQDKTLHVINVKEIDDDTRQLLDKFFVSICEGDSDSELELVKLRLAKFLETKNEDTKMGAVAEFLVHVYLNKMNFKQEFLFFNLEEGSIKKGFDGLFSKGSETYLVESKSGSILTNGISHKKKLKTAYSDLKEYVAGKSEKGKNNPWKNAFNHASHCDVGAAQNIRKKIKALRDMYDLGKYTKIEDYNVVACSTIYLSSEWNGAVNNNILMDYDFINEFSAVSLSALCITKSSLQKFIDYLGE